MSDHSYTPYELGWMAGLRGDDPRSCPFEKLSSEWSEWWRAHGYGVQYVEWRDEHLTNDANDFYARGEHVPGVTR